MPYQFNPFTGTFDLVSTGGTAVVAYEHDQASPSSTWTIVHGLGYRPAGIHVEDTSGMQWDGRVVYLDADSLTIEFNAAFAGKAFLS